MTERPVPEPGRALTVTVNGEPRLLPPAATVKTLLSVIGISERGVAVAVDGQVVPRSAWADAPLRAGAAVEIVTAAAGG
jgi:sulfur carrier protein